MAEFRKERTNVELLHSSDILHVSFSWNCWNSKVYLVRNVRMQD